MFAALLPKSAPFFERLFAQNALLCQVAEQNVRLFGNLENRYHAYKRIAEIEHEADTLYRKISRALSACSRERLFMSTWSATRSACTARVR